LNSIPSPFSKPSLAVNSSRPHISWSDRPAGTRSTSRACVPRASLTRRNNSSCMLQQRKLGVRGQIYVLGVRQIQMSELHLLPSVGWKDGSPNCFERCLSSDGNRMNYQGKGHRNRTICLNTSNQEMRGPKGGQEWSAGHSGLMLLHGEYLPTR
jgi:hypothetical protein